MMLTTCHIHEYCEYIKQKLFLSLSLAFPSTRLSFSCVQRYSSLSKRTRRRLCDRRHELSLDVDHLLLAIVEVGRRDQRHLVLRGTGTGGGSAGRQARREWRVCGASRVHLRLVTREQQKKKQTLRREAEISYPGGVNPSGISMKW